MAQASALKTYDVTTNVRDVTDLISVVANTETPFYSSIEKVQATGVTHETQQYALTTGNENNAVIEGADYAMSLASAPTTTANWTQIFYKMAKVSKDQQAVSTYGIDDMLAKQLEWRMKEIATDIEKAMIQGTGNSGASGTARLMKGLLTMIVTNVNTGTGTGNEALTETMFNDTLQTIYDAGGRPKDVLASSGKKRTISGFTAGSTKQIMSDDKRLTNAVDVYESDFGVLQIHLDPFMSTSELAIYQRELWESAVLRPIVVEDYPSQGSYVAKTMEGALTLGSRNERGSGKITQLS